MLICVDECMYDQRQNIFNRVEHLQNSITTRSKQTFETYDTLDASSLRLQTATHTMKSWRFPISGFATVTCEMRRSYITAILPHAWRYSNLSHHWNFTHILKPYTATILNVGQVMASYSLVRRAGAFLISLSWLIFSYFVCLFVLFCVWRLTSNAGAVISHHPIRYLS